MPQSELMIAGVQLMALGMGIVFAFLAILIVTLKLMSLLAGKFSTEEEVVAARSVSVTRVPNENKELIAVVTAAIARFRTIKNT